MVELRKTFSLEAPTFIEGAIADATDNTLFYGYWKDGLRVYHKTLENPPEMPPGMPDLVTFITPQIALEDASDTWLAAGDRVELTHASERPFYITVEPTLLLAQGPMRLRLFVELWNSTVPDISAAVRFIADSTPPMGQRDPLPLVITPNAITDQVLNGTGAIAKVPAYDFAEKDLLLLWWASPEGDPIGQSVHHLELPKNEHDFEIPAQVIREAGSGVKWVTYRLVDKAGNLSNMALPTKVQVALGELATGLKPPSVPLAEDDGVLDLTDARTGVFVHIQPFEGAQAGDTLDVWWGGTKIPQTPTWPFPGNDLKVLISPAILQQEYGSASGPTTLEVAYEVRRGGILMDSRQSKSITTDYYIGGPADPDPEWPDPINEALELPVLVPPVSSDDNKLLPEDYGQDATVTVLLHKDIAVGQVVKFYWDDTYLPGIDHIVAANEPGTTISQVVKWSVIEAGTNGIRNLWYRVYSSTPGNYWESQPQSVEVSAVKLPLLSFPDLNPLNLLACESLRDGSSGNGKVIRVAVPDLSAYLKPGDSLELEWMPWRRFMGEEPELKLESAALIETITIDELHPITGFAWEVPYIKHILPIYDGGAIEDRIGRGRVHYRLGGGKGSSEITQGMVAMTVSNSPCSI
jgi:hypothetical protein